MKASINKIDTNTESLRPFIRTIITETESRGTFMFADVVPYEREGENFKFLKIISGTVISTDSLLDENGTLFMEKLFPCTCTEIVEPEIGSSNGFRNMDEVMLFIQRNIADSKNDLYDHAIELVNFPFDPANEFEQKTMIKRSTSNREMSISSIKRELLAWEGLYNRLKLNQKKSVDTYV